jgi:hypothetical protein
MKDEDDLTLRSSTQSQFYTKTIEKDWAAGRLLCVKWNPVQGKRVTGVYDHGEKLAE